MPWNQIFFPLKGSDVALTLFEEFPVPYKGLCYLAQIKCNYPSLLKNL
jgi:hypothetical protein